MSLQYLEKEVREEVDFLHENKYQNSQQVDFNTLNIKVFYKGILSLLMGMIKYSQGTQSNKLATALILKYLSAATPFVFYCDAKHPDISWGPSHVCCYLFLLFVIYYVSTCCYEEILLNSLRMTVVDVCLFLIKFFIKVFS